MRISTVFLSVLSTFFVFLYSCNKDETCTEEEKEYILLKPEGTLDSIFPYNKNWTTLKYLHSNNQIKADTLIFKLSSIDSVKQDAYQWEDGCKVYSDRIEQFEYLSTSTTNHKKIRITYDYSDYEFLVGGIDEDFDEISPSAYADFSDFEYQGLYYETKRINPTINGKRYFNVYEKSYLIYWTEGCDVDSVSFMYSPNYGFLKVENSCNNESYSLIVD